MACDNAIYHVSFQLADSVPKAVRDRCLREREYLVATTDLDDNDLSEEVERKIKYLYSERIEKYLDVGYGECYLQKTEIAKLIANVFNFFDNRHYRLHAWCIMPNHVHVIVEILAGNNLSKIIHSWKSYTAHKAKEILGFKGPFCQQDAYNHIIRSKKSTIIKFNILGNIRIKLGYKIGFGDGKLIMFNFVETRRLSPFEGCT